MINGVLIIPTGLNCALGGDAAFLPGVKLISSCVDNLIVNPNAVNASDINELPHNSLYVEGSTIDRFLEGKLNLSKTKRHNKILLAVNPPITPAEINAVNAGIWGLGAEIELIELKVPLMMTSIINRDGTAGGSYSGVDELISQVSTYDFDALGIQTDIDCDDATETNYWANGGVNPWGGIEAIVSKLIAEKINKPVAHAPKAYPGDLFEKIIVKKTMAPEFISNTYLFCILKGLHYAPQLEFMLSKYSSNILHRADIDFLLSPHGCWGRPHEACYENGIPIIIVKENTTCFSKNFSFSKGFTYKSPIIFVENYLEAAGVIMALNSKINYKGVLL